MINKSATKAATVKWVNGNADVLWLGHNRNTGATIVWVVTHRDGKPGPSRRVTGGNIQKLAAEITRIPAAEGSVEWHGQAARALYC